MNQGKLEVVKQEMARVNVDILGISELKWVANNPTIELPELTQDWEIDSWRAQTEPCVHQEQRKEQ